MKTCYPFLVLFIFIMSNTSAQGQSNNSIGIVHTPFDLANFVVLADEIDEGTLSVMPGTEIVFSKRTGADQYLLISLGYTRTSSSYVYESDRGNNYDYDWKSTIQLIDVKVGVKFTRGNRQAGSSVGTTYIMGGKRFGSYSYDENDGDYSYDTDADEVAYNNKRISPYMLAVGFGAEYLFTQSLSMSINLHGDMAFITSASYEDDDNNVRTSKSLMIHTRPIIGLHIYY